MPARPPSPPESDRSRRSPPHPQHDLRPHEAARTFLAVMDVVSNELVGGRGAEGAFRRAKRGQTNTAQHRGPRRVVPNALGWPSEAGARSRG